MIIDLTALNVNNERFDACFTRPQVFIYVSHRGGCRDVNALVWRRGGVLMRWEGGRVMVVSDTNATKSTFRVNWSACTI